MKNYFKRNDADEAAFPNDALPVLVHTFAFMLLLTSFISFSGGILSSAPASPPVPKSTSGTEGKTFPLAAFRHGNVIEPTLLNAGGREQPVWQTSARDRNLTFRSQNDDLIEGQLDAATGKRDVYLAVYYLDKGYGKLNITTRGHDGKELKPDKYTWNVLTDSGKWVTSYQRLRGVPAGWKPELNLSLNQSQDNVLTVGSISVQVKPFSDKRFQYLLDEAWKRPYTGLSLTKGVDNTTLRGKVMAGYQGWFRTPNDPEDRGWIHWGQVNRGEFTIDMWPDTSEYPDEVLEKAGDVKLASGRQARLFSSCWPEVARTHFRWMREHNIDGVFVQRFVSRLYPVHGTPEWALGSIREAANQEGRIWAIEYDISGCADDKLLDTLKKDWAWMVDDLRVREDKLYAREKGKPVVFIWGMSVEGRNISPQTANKVVDFFKNDPKYGGNYVIGGLSGSWRKLGPEWQEHIGRLDGALAWMSRSYAEDVTDFKKKGVDYYPHVWPGFSWANLKHLNVASTEGYTPRNGGLFYQGLYSKAAEAGADRLFVGMYDEYDESTAIIPMSDDVPATPSRPGVTVKLHAGTEFRGKTLMRNLPAVAYDFGAPSVENSVPRNNFAMRWEGQIIPPKTGNYVLEIEGAPGDSAAVFINEKKVINVHSLAQPGAGTGTEKNVPGDNPSTAKVEFKALQPVILRIDYTHRTAAGAMRLTWHPPGGERQAVPASAFQDAWGRFITNEGSNPKWWLKLTGEAREMINGKRAVTDGSAK